MPGCSKALLFFHVHAFEGLLPLGSLETEYDLLIVSCLLCSRRSPGRCLARSPLFLGAGFPKCLVSPHCSFVLYKGNTRLLGFRGAMGFLRGCVVPVPWRSQMPPCVGSWLPSLQAVCCAKLEEEDLEGPRLHFLEHTHKKQQPGYSNCLYVSHGASHCC